MKIFCKKVRVAFYPFLRSQLSDVRSKISMHSNNLVYPARLAEQAVRTFKGFDKEEMTGVKFDGIGTFKRFFALDMDSNELHKWCERFRKSQQPITAKDVAPLEKVSEEKETKVNLQVLSASDERMSLKLAEVVFCFSVV